MEYCVNPLISTFPCFVLCDFGELYRVFSFGGLGRAAVAGKGRHTKIYTLGNGRQTHKYIQKRPLTSRNRRDYSSHIFLIRGGGVLAVVHRVTERAAHAVIKPIQ